jgi:hypothetical protein
MIKETIEKEFLSLLKEEDNKETLQNWLYQSKEEDLTQLFGEENYSIILAENYYDFSCEYLKKYLLSKKIKA